MYVNGLTIEVPSKVRRVVRYADTYMNVARVRQCGNEIGFG
jgi:hypothetical protein